MLGLAAGAADPVAAEVATSVPIQKRPDDDKRDQRTWTLR
jgi:hypothetical protein